MEKATRRLRKVLLACVLLLAAAPVYAQTAPAMPSLARVAFDAGKQAYSAQKYNTAAAHWAKAYELTNDPTLLFNIGQAYRLGGQPDQAIAMYRAFLRESPVTDPNRDIAESKIELLEIMQLRPPVQPRKTAPAPAPTPDASNLLVLQFEERKRPSASANFSAPSAAPYVDQRYVIAGAAVTGVLAVTATVLSLNAHSTYNTLRETCGAMPLGCTQAQRARVTNLANWATALWIGTALVGGATGVAFAIDYTHNTREASISLAGKF